MDKRVTSGEKIKQARLLKKKSMREFASECGLSASVINLLEHNRINKPSMNTLRALSKVLDLPLLEVCEMYDITTVENENNVKEKAETPRQKLKKALLEYNLPPEEVFQIIEYIEFKVEREKNNPYYERYKDYI